MATRKNLLEGLRKEKGCTLSQEQIAIKMGLPTDYNRYDGSRHDDIINNFETRKTYSWDVLHYFRYCNVIGCSPEEPFIRLYPEEPFSKKFLEKHPMTMNMETKEPKMEDNKTHKEKQLINTELFGTTVNTTDYSPRIYKIPVSCEEDQIRIAERNKRSSPLDTEENTCVFGSPVTGVNYSYILPEVITAMSKGKNIFLIADTGLLQHDLEYEAKKSGYNIYIWPDHENKKYTNWMSTSLGWQDAIVDILASARDNADKETTDDAYRDILSSLLFSYYSRTDVIPDDSLRSFSHLCEHIMRFTADDIAKMIGKSYPPDQINSLTVEILATLHNLSQLDREEGDKLSEVFNKKHLILYNTAVGGQYSKLNGTLLLSRYIDLIIEVKEHFKNWPDTREYEIILQGVSSLPLNIDLIKKVSKHREKTDIKLVANLRGIEEIKDLYPEEWEKMMESFPYLYLTGINKNGYGSQSTEDYIISKIENSADKEEAEKRMRKEIEQAAVKAGYKSAEELLNNPECYRDCYIDRKDNSIHLVIDPVYSLRTEKMGKSTIS